MKFKILIVALLFSCFSFGQIAAWQLNGALGSEASLNASTIDPNLNTSTLIRNGGLTTSTLANAFASTNYTATGTRADAVTNNRGQSFTISALPGYAVSLSTLDVRFRRSSTGPNAFAWFYSLDGTTFTQIASDISYTLTTTGGDAQAQLNLSGISALQNVASGTTITIRLNGWGATATTGTFAIGRSLTTGATDYSLAIGGSVNPLGPCTVPLNQASAATFSNPTTNGATISWANGASTSGSMVVIRPTSALVLDPSTSTSYTPNANYATAGQIDVDNRVVYLGGGTTVNVTGLNPETQYTATVYSYNALDCYNTTAPVSVNFYTLSTEPTAQPPALSFTCALGAPTTSVINLTFPAANTLGGDGYIILYRIGAAPTGVPTDGAFHAPGTVFGDAIVLGQTANTGTTTTYAATGLNSGTNYFFSLVPFNGYLSVAGTLNYRTAATILTTNCSTAAATPTIIIANNGAQVAAANVPQGSTDLVLYKFQLTVGIANATLTGVTATTNGTYLASDLVNLKVRYSVDNILDAADVTLSTKTLTLGPGLQTFPSFLSQTITAGTIGYVFITADISSTAVLNNQIAVNALLIGNVIFSSGAKSATTTAGGTQTISPSAPAVPTAFTRVCTSNTTQSVTWAAPATGSFDGYLLVVRDGATPNAVTTIVASSQPFNLDYSLAPTYNATTSRVLYIGTGTSATITGLTPGVNYTYALYAYKNNGASSIFSATATTITQTTAVPNVTGFGSTPANASGTVTWSNPNSACYDEVLAVVTTSPGITFAPSGNGSAYVPNTVYAAPNQVVFNSVGSFVTITGLTNGVTYYVEIFVRKGTEWSSGVETSFTPNLATVFKPGELIFVGFDGQYAGTGPDDQYMVATMVDIIPGTTFSIANSRYEAGAAANVRTDKWGGAGNDPSTPPGVTNFTYNGSGNIPAGSVLVLNTNSSNVFSYEGVITGTTLTNRTADFVTTQPFGVGTTPNITTTNGDGEQIYLFQGNFVSDGIVDLNEANYILTGTLLHGFTIKTGWVPLTSACSGTNGGGSNRQSRLPNSLTCFNIESAVANTISGYYRNSAEHGSTSIRNIIKAVANVTTNWVIGTTRYTIDATSSATNRAGKTFIIGASETSGQWVGDFDTNWFNCSNWGRLTVPDETVDVVIDNVTSINNSVIDYTATYSDFYADLAVCNNLTINGRTIIIQANPNNKLEVYGNVAIAASGTLDMNDGSNGTPDGQLYLYGNWNNNGTETNFDQGESTIHFKGSIPQVINNVAPRGTELFYNVVLDNDFNTAISNDLIAQGDLTINATRALNIDSNGFVFAYRRLNHNGDLSIANNGQFIQVDETDNNTGVYTGTKFQLTRTAQAKNFDYVYWSAPTENFTVTGVPTNNRYEWNTLFANANGTLGNWVTASGTMTKGKGYIARASNGSATPVGLSTIFTGKPHNGQFNFDIYRGNYDGADYDADLTNPNNVWTTRFDDNWNLVGNPYPSAIDAEEFLVQNQTKIEGAVWIWTHGLNPTSNVSPFYNNYQYNYLSSDYIKYNGLGSTDPDTFAGKIASGQGFMVNMLHTTATPNTITFTNNMRSDASMVQYDNTDFFRSVSTNTVGPVEEKHRIWLDIINTTSGQMDRTLLGYSTSSTLGVDHLYDCIFRPTTELSMYSIINSEPFIIQGRPLPFNNFDLVPMGIRIVAAGNHTIAIKKVDGLFEQNQDIYLEDKQLNIIHDLRQAPYNFTSSVGTFNDRFVLRYTTTALSNQDFESIDSSVFVSANDGQINIKSINESLSEVSVYDVLGREIIKKTNIASSDLILNNITATNQALIVKIKLENGEVVTRKVVL
ncbi:T9SS sorting signal type C domain-containing protein [Flavobacterium sp.]|uniref:fibronectin type III domain-containing protein n=1 Tax=Flavobacterium sp. TaxID=239 RepID=UPI002629FF06|nr:T9SS sorting signal type C domain-containing protein [Flavobacterium sp.]